MKPTWEILELIDKDCSNCKCLICEEEFTFLGDGHFNMKLIKCPTCKQQVWVPRCPNGCPSFKEKEK